ncbi:MAG: DUF924 domain-containing protein [Ectothiorhodospiraceae bacterium]|nr:DUF924 domain-containing protein [Ectothiorhodospiraceae bacterium]
MTAEDVLEFWFQELTPEQWFAKDAGLDREIGRRFGDVHRQAAAGECWTWRDSARGRLAEIIVLDQFSRNIHRDRPEAFVWDGMALVLAQEAIRAGADRELPPQRRAFLYMPYMHSESLRIHRRAMQLFAQPGLETNLEFERKHKAIIERFGRYPHRNAVLGRESTAEELDFLKQPGSGF